MSIRKPFAVLHDIQQLLVREFPSSQEFLRQVLAKVNELVGFDFGFVGVVVRSGQRRSIVVRDRLEELVGAEAGRWATFIRDLPIGGRELPKDERSFTGFAVHTGRPRWSGDVRRDPYYWAANAATNSELAVPITLDGEVIGVINLEDRSRDAYTHEDVSILMLVAKLIAAPLDRMMVREGLRRSIRDVLEHIDAQLDLVPAGDPIDVETYDALARTIASALHSDSCRIWLLNGAGRKLQLRGRFGPPPRSGERANNFVRSALRRGSTLKSAPDAFGGFTHSRLEHRHRLNDRRLPEIVTPVIRRGRAVGVIEVGLRRRTRENPQRGYSASDVEMMELLQSQLGTALELKTLETARRRQALQHGKQLSKLSRIFAELDLPKTLAAAVEEIPRLCHGRSCSIFLWDDTRRAFVLRASQGLDEVLTGVAEYRPGEGLTGWVGLHGRPLNLTSRTPEVLSRIAVDLKWARKYEEGRRGEDLLHRPFVAAPIFLDGRTAGVIRVGDATSGPFTESDVETLTTVASHIAAAIAYRQRTDDRLRLLDNLHTLLDKLNGALADVKTGGHEFPATAIEATALDAADVLKADVLALYAFDPQRQQFETPPIIKGTLRDPVRMAGALSPTDAPWRILKRGPCYWTDVRRVRSVFDGARECADGTLRPRFAAREEIASTAAVRLDVGGDTVGVLFLNFRQRQRFDAHQREMIETFAGQLSLSMELSRVYRRMRSLASREEIEDLSMELHDGGLSLINVAFALCERLRLQLGNGVAAAAARDLDLLETTIDRAVNEIRQVMNLMLSAPIEQSGLIGAIERLAHEVWQPQGVFVNIPTREPDIPARVKRHLYRIIETAVGNAITHGRAAHVTVGLDAKNGFLNLQVTDNGNGFDTSLKIAPGHYGIRSLARRTESLNGSLDLQSAPGLGTRIAVTVPIDGAAYVKEALAAAPASTPLAAVRH